MGQALKLRAQKSWRAHLQEPEAQVRVAARVMGLPWSPGVGSCQRRPEPSPLAAQLAFVHRQGMPRPGPFNSLRATARCHQPVLGPQAHELPSSHSSGAVQAPAGIQVTSCSARPNQPPAVGPVWERRAPGCSQTDLPRPSPNAAPQQRAAYGLPPCQLFPRGRGRRPQGPGRCLSRTSPAS